MLRPRSHRTYTVQPQHSAGRDDARRMRDGGMRMPVLIDSSFSCDEFGIMFVSSCTSNLALALK